MNVTYINVWVFYFENSQSRFHIFGLNVNPNGYVNSIFGVKTNVKSLHIKRIKILNQTNKPHRNYMIFQPRKNQTQRGCPYQNMSNFRY